jgi:hypothetical protein
MSVRDADDVAYTLEAFLARSSVAADLAQAIASVAVPLDQGVALVPLREDGDPENAARRAARLSDAGPVAWVEAEYFGGVGEQHAVVWRHGVGEEVGTINAALQALGVRRSGDHDEFDTLGLGRYRATADWITTR